MSEGVRDPWLFGERARGQRRVEQAQDPRPARGQERGHRNDDSYRRRVAEKPAAAFDAPIFLLAINR